MVLDFGTPTQYFYNSDGTLEYTETEPNLGFDPEYLANTLEAGQAGDFGDAAPFAIGGDDPFANPVAFGGNAIMGRQVPADFQNILNGGNMGASPMNLPGYNWGTGIGGLLPSGQGNWLQGMINQYDTAWQQEQARRDMYNRWREQQAHDERMMQIRMDAFRDAFGEGGTDELASNIELPRGYKTPTSFAYHQDPEDLPAVAKGDIPNNLPKMPELPANMDQKFVDAGAAPALQILNRIAGAGAQAGVDEGAGKLIEEVGQKQADLAAGKDAAQAEQGVAQHRWVQSLQEAINQVRNRADENALGADRFKQSAYQTLLGPGVYG